MIDQAIEHQRAEHGIDIHRLTERRNDDGFEDAEPRRHMAEHAETDGDRIDGEESRPADDPVGQQHVEHGGRGRDIERR